MDKKHEDDKIKEQEEKQAKKRENATAKSIRLLKFSLLKFFKNTLSIDGTDRKGTIEGIKKDMIFRGHSAWILMFSILIASIGLNTNSTAVIIGAMLISPLMSPILAIGLSVGINDFETLKRALKNFAIAIVISLITSVVYFLLTPIKEPTSEMLGRINPTSLDVLIAIFGGFAGIIAGLRREKTNVIPGVAIATALMPPLCTAGYGLATWNLHFFFGAMYLFFINSVFISISTLLTVKYLKFPKKRFLSTKKERKIRFYMLIFIIIVILPSAKIFWDVIQESKFQSSADKFIKEQVKTEGSELINKKVVFNDTSSVINLYFIGKPISENTIEKWSEYLNEYELAGNKSFLKKFLLTDTTIIKVFQSKDNTEALVNQMNEMNANISEEVKMGIIEEIYQKNAQTIAEKNELILDLKTELLLHQNVVPIEKLMREFKEQYKKIDGFSYANSFSVNNDGEIDTIPTFVIKWKNGISSYNRRIQKDELAAVLKIRFDFDTIIVIDD